ncbi:hypothetical protein FGB62_310g02 [Gracilaria domingensis]|nr:hypothetical protein FGB62_310g02 [Gracilaria domingensis]
MKDDEGNHLALVQENAGEDVVAAAKTNDEGEALPAAPGAVLEAEEEAEEEQEGYEDIHQHLRQVASRRCRGSPEAAKAPSRPQPTSKSCLRDPRT